MNVTIFAFNKGKAGTYRKREGIIFTYNGQTHGDFPKDFFKRKKVGLSYLANDLLVTVDCSKFSIRAREDFLMNSRDRISGGEFRSSIEKALERLLKDHEGLRALRERRRNEEIESKLDDNKPLEEVLKSLLKQSPTLSSLFLKGTRLSNAFKSKNVRDKDEKYEGHRFPTYFKFKGKDYGKHLNRECPINNRCRITFETDVENDYFSRDLEPGDFSFYYILNEQEILVENYTLNLHNGIANLNFQLPHDVSIGDTLKFTTQATDTSRTFPFENSFQILVKEESKPSGGKPKSRKPPSENTGNDRDAPSGIQLPNIKEVREEEWGSHGDEFDKFTSLRIKDSGFRENDLEDNSESPICYDFFINVDNFYLKNELKSNNSEYKITQARFKYGLVLLGLGLINKNAHDQKTANENNGNLEEKNNENDIETRVAEFSDAISPILLPMLETLGRDLIMDAFLNEDISETVA